MRTLPDQYRNYAGSEAAFGLQPGELYEAAEVCHTDRTLHTFHGREVEVYYDQLASIFSQWKAFCRGIGTVSRMDREEVVAEMHRRILEEVKP